MPQFVAVSREQHSQKKWRRPESHAFAATDAAVPLVAGELARAALSMPLAFVSEADRFVLVALLSLTPKRNMFIGPDGRWLGSYIPVWIRTYPFRLLPKPGSDEMILCVDTDSGLVVESGPTGEDFFSADGNVSPTLKSVLDLLLEMERSRKATDLAVAALAEAGVIKPWPIKLKTEQGEQAIDGLHHVDEPSLRGLADDAFLKLRKSAALPIAYGQLLSTGQLGIFANLAKIHAQLKPPPVGALPETLDSLFELPNDDMIKFD